MQWIRTLLAARRLRKSDALFTTQSGGDPEALMIGSQMAAIMERVRDGTATPNDDRELKRLKALRLSQILKPRN